MMEAMKEWDLGDGRFVMAESEWVKESRWELQMEAVEYGLWLMRFGVLILIKQNDAFWYADANIFK